MIYGEELMLYSDDRDLKRNDIVIHFKNELDSHAPLTRFMYKIVAVDVLHTETGEDMIVYQSLADGKVYARPSSMFLSDVDKTKYPSIKTRYRFTKLAP